MSVLINDLFVDKKNIIQIKNIDDKKGTFLFLNNI